VLQTALSQVVFNWTRILRLVEETSGPGRSEEVQFGEEKKVVG
jgi:hypothetical protein